MDLLFFAVGALILACIFWAITATKPRHKHVYDSGMGSFQFKGGSYALQCTCGDWQMVGRGEIGK